MSQVALWGVLALFLFLAEIITVNLVTIWFVISALVSLIMAYFGISFQIQLISFITISVALLAFSYPFIRSRFNRSYIKTNYERVIGEKGIVEEDIDEIEGSGVVRVMGQTWSARSASKETIPRGKTIEILEVKGVSLIVREYKTGVIE